MTPKNLTFCDSCTQLRLITYYPATDSYHCAKCEEDTESE